MKQLIVNLLTFISLTFASSVWAGPVEDVAQISGPRQQAFQQGNVENWVAAFADNAVLQSSFSTFRIEGKEAIRAFFTQLFQSYPKRGFVVRQPVARAFGDNWVIQNGYTVINLTNEKGESKAYDARFTTVWNKIDGRWQIVDSHVSRVLPAQ